MGVTQGRFKMTLLKVTLILLLLHFHATKAIDFKVASLNLSVPYLMTNEDGSHDGFIIDMLDTACPTEASSVEEMKLTYQIVSPEDFKYGALDSSTGKWSGMVGMVVENKADFIAADLTMTAERGQVLDFTPPFYTSGLTILVKTTDANANQLGQVFQPFSVVLWIMLLVLYLLTG